jgi:hypothetical protein
MTWMTQNTQNAFLISKQQIPITNNGDLILASYNFGMQFFYNFFYLSFFTRIETHDSGRKTIGVNVVMVFD